MSASEASAKSMEKEKETAPRSTSAKKRSADASFNMDEIRELADLVDQHGFTDFEFENEKIRVRLSKSAPVAPPVYAAPAPVAAAAPTAAQEATSATEASEALVDADAGLFKILSPIVGTFYRSPGPDKDPYVKEGGNVSPDSVVCIIEAMKLMNEIQAETSGQVVKVYVENGQPVEFGQPLFGIKQ